jgi:hypothetical protein
MDRIFGNEYGNVGVMGVFYGYSFWMDRIVAMNVGVMGVFYGVLFWMDRQFLAMNVEYVCVLWMYYVDYFGCGRPGSVVPLMGIKCVE